MPIGNQKIYEDIFNLRLMSKQTLRTSKKCEKEEKAEKLKVKKAIEQGNIDIAKIYAQNAIRKKNEQLNYLRLASRLDAVVARLDQQAKMQGITRNMGSIVKTLDKALASNNLEKVAMTMDQFERQFENLDIQAEFVESAMNNQATLSTPADEVSMLMQQVADEHNLELSMELPGASTQHQVAAPAAAAAADPESDLTKRLAELRGK